MNWNRYVAIGDSLTEGIGDPHGDGVRGWVPSFVASLRAANPDVEVHNLAFRGRVTADVTATQQAEGLALQPDLVTCLTGGNDVLFRPATTRDSLHRDLTELLAPFAEQGATVVVGSIPDFTRAAPWFRRGPTGARFHDQLMVLNSVVEQVADEIGGVFCDLHGMPYLSAAWSIDRLHPSALGHWWIGATMARSIGLPDPPPLEHPSTVGGHVARSARELEFLVTKFFNAPGSPTLRQRISRGRPAGPGPSSG